MSTHHYSALLTWTGNNGSGTASYRGYDRSYSIEIEGKELLNGSSDPTFRGDRSKHNPEDLLLAALSSCHMLSYLHLCVDAGVIVVAYTDNAEGTMIHSAEGGGKFSEVILNPLVEVSDPSMIEKANALHKEANRLCFIANSVNFPVRHHPNAVSA